MSWPFSVSMSSWTQSHFSTEDAPAICQHEPLPACTEWKAWIRWKKSLEPWDWTQAPCIKKRPSSPLLPLPFMYWTDCLTFRWPQIVTHHCYLKLYQSCRTCNSDSFLPVNPPIFFFLWERWDPFEHLYTIVCRALDIPFHSLVSRKLQLYVSVFVLLYRRCLSSRLITRVY